MVFRERGKKEGILGRRGRRKMGEKGWGVEEKGWGVGESGSESMAVRDLDLLGWGENEGNHGNWEMEERIVESGKTGNESDKEGEKVG